MIVRSVRQQSDLPHLPNPTYLTSFRASVSQPFLR